MIRFFHSKPWLAFSILMAAAFPIHGQEILYSFEGVGANDGFGISVAGAGDVNGDGFDDFIIGSPFAAGVVLDSGVARVYSGLDGSLLYEFSGAAGGDQFGASVSGAGDVNLDGFDDVIVGAPGYSFGAFQGRARVLSGFDGSTLHVVTGSRYGDFFGFSVSGAGDADADGFSDFVVGAYNAEDLGYPVGTATLFSGATGAVRYVSPGVDFYDGYGYSVGGVGDMDQDGFDDLIVGAPFDDDNGSESGSVQVISGFDGQSIYFIRGPTAGEMFGYSVDGAGDVNGDGTPDFIIGAPEDAQGGHNAGSARVISGADGALLYTFLGNAPGSYLGWSVAGAGDVNGDGFDDLITGAPKNSINGILSGKAVVYSGQNGSILYAYDGRSTGDWFGRSVHSAGDLNGDGYADLILGAAQLLTGGPSNQGYAEIYAGGPPPSLVLSVPHLVRAQSATLEVSGATPLGTIYFGFTYQGYGATFVPQLNLMLSLNQPELLAARPADAAGSVTLTGQVPWHAGAPLPVWFQAAEAGRASNWIRREIE